MDASVFGAVRTNEPYPTWASSPTARVIIGCLHIHQALGSQS